MISKRIALLLSCVTAMLLLNAGAVRSQNDRYDQAFINPDGWNIGSLQHLKTKAQSQISVGGINVNIAPLLMPEEGILFENTAYYLNANGTRTLHPSPMNAYKASKFDVNGHVFCYTVFGPGVAIAQISQTERRVAALGCESFFAFYDQDGDGKFETLVALDERAPFTPHVPSWARK